MSESRQYLAAFEQLVALKYEIYNSLFTSLPFADLPIVGAELKQFNELCHQLLQENKTPLYIVKYFFKKIVPIQDPEQQNRILFLLLQFVERQVVLFDALEDAAYEHMRYMQGPGSLADLLGRVNTQEEIQQLYDLLQEYKARIVLTAHPTQFYPPQVLTIIEALCIAIKNNHLETVYNLLLQLGKTSFKNEKQPTPLDEARSLFFFLKHVFYPVFKHIQFSVQQFFQRNLSKDDFLPAAVELGFWPGGDRDGNPNVTPEITAQVAKELRQNILSLYQREVLNLKNHLTFPHMWEALEKIYHRIEATKLIGRKYTGLIKSYVNDDEFVGELSAIKSMLNHQHQGLFSDLVEQLIVAVKVFGFHFASIDLRQDSQVHASVLQFLFSLLVKKQKMPIELRQGCKNYFKLPAKEKCALLNALWLMKRPQLLDAWLQKNSLLYDVIGSLRVALEVQGCNGERGLHRYIISNTHEAYHVLEVMLLAYWAGWPKEKLKLDIVPLFETIEDLQNAKSIMQQLYRLPWYRQHLSFRDKQQYIMLGFSDGTKDGGYFTANWQIFCCKKALAELALTESVKTIFFDGRGGPPARGGGSTHQFYRAFEDIFHQRQIHLTIQGQTISTKFGNSQTATHNVEQLLTAGMQSQIFSKHHVEMTEADVNLLEQLSLLSHQTYLDLKNDKNFVPYLEKITPLHYYGELNIASRPPRRKRVGEMNFADLRAIPFVGAWSQMKQNVPGFYGLGAALKFLWGKGKQTELKKLFVRSLFFRTLLQNAMQSLAKSNFRLTAYLKKDKDFGVFWKKLHHEAKLTEVMIKKISGQAHLLDDNPVLQRSIGMREDLVLPLLVIQQYAMMELRNNKNLSKKQRDILHKLVLKTLAANINASRNSA